MKVRHWLFFLILLGLSGRTFPQTSPPEKPRNTLPISTSTAEGETASADSGAAVFSGDGRFAFFLSDAGNLVLDDQADGFSDVFRRDLMAGVIVRVSVGSGTDGRGDGPATSFSVSTNGRWVTFSSRASNLVPGDTNSAEDVFFRDIETGVTRLVSHTPKGVPGDAESFAPLISGDGRWVAFDSSASNLTSTTDTNRTHNVYLWDRETDLITAIDVELEDAISSRPSSCRVLSHDGDLVVYQSGATNVTSGGTGMKTDLVIWSRTTGRTRRIELPGPRPMDLVAPVTTYNPVLSATGRQLAFRTRHLRDSVGPADGVWWIDLGAEMPAIRISADLFTSPPVGTADASGPVMSEDGHRVAFEAKAGESEPLRVHLWSPSMGPRTLDGWVTDGQPQFPEPSGTWSPVLSPDGTRIAFQTDAAVPAAGINSQGGWRFYVRELASGQTRTLFPNIQMDFPLLAPVFSPRGDSLLFQTTAVLPGIPDMNRSSDVFLAPATLEQAELVSRRHPERSSNTGAGPSILGSGSLSDDGRWLVFTSTADNLVGNDSNGRRDVFIRDLVAGKNHLVSVGLDGMSPAADSWQPKISASGKRVVFVSTATNLVFGTTPPGRAIYVRDIESGTTVLASAEDGGSRVASHAAFNPQISADGERVTFESAATNLVHGAGASDTRTKLFLRILAARRTLQVSDRLANPGSEESLGTFSAAMDDEGSKVVFLSGPNVQEYNVSTGVPRQLTTGIRVTALSLSRDGRRLATLARQGTNPDQKTIVHWHDLAAGTNWPIAVAPNGVLKPFNNVSISTDGRVVAFDSVFTPPGLSDTNGVTDVFTFDVDSGILSRESTSLSSKEAGNGASDRPALTADGKYIVFRSDASDLVESDTNHVSDVFLRNRVTREVTRLSSRLGLTSVRKHGASNPLIDQDGQVAVFHSRSGDLARGDYNREMDIFASAFAKPLPVLSEPALVTGDRLRFELRGTVGTGVAIQFSRDLVDWVTQSRHTLPDSVELPLSPESPSMFYRAIVEE